MMPRGPRAFVPAVALALVVCGLTAVSACRRAQRLCEFCRMPVPEATAASVVVNGREVQVCDPRCALTHQQQTGQPTTLETVTDFESGRPLDPAQAFFLTGSDTAPDVGQVHVSRPMEPIYREWHRCLPSVLAFASRTAAVRYEERHGGTVQTPVELGLAVRQRAGGVSPGSGS